MGGVTRRARFSLDLTHPVMGVTRRTGWLIEGTAGWAEWSPLPGWSRGEAVRAFRGAAEAASRPFPPVLQPVVTVNAMIPRVAPRVAERLAASSSCATIKVKVGDPAGEDRARAVRGAVGRGTKVRLDANGAWDPDTAEVMLRRLAPLDIELVEDPVAGLADLAVLRRRSPIPLAAEMAIRSLADVDRKVLHDAADAVVIKPQRIGGVTNALRAAAMAGIPVIISSALETSVGLATALAVAAALPAGPFAHGLGTAVLLRSDVTSDPLTPTGGTLRPGRVTPDLVLSDGAIARPERAGRR